MLKLKIAFFLTIVFEIIPCCFNPDSTWYIQFLNSDLVWYVKDFCNLIIVLVWMVAVFWFVPVFKINERSLIFLFIIFQIVNIISYPIFYYIDLYNFIIFWNLYFLFVIIGFYYISLKVYNYKSDDIKDNNIYLCLWKPLRKRSLFLSLFGAPVGSVCIYANSHIYSFSWKTGLFRKKFKSHSEMRKKFIIIDTKQSCNWKILYMLEDLIGEKARIKKYLFIRVRCILILRDVLSLIGLEYKPKGLEFIPSFYALKVLRMRQDERYKNE